MQSRTALLLLVSSVSTNILAGSPRCELPRSARDRLALAAARTAAQHGGLAVQALEPVVYLDYDCPAEAADLLRERATAAMSRTGLSVHEAEALAEMQGLQAVAEAEVQTSTEHLDAARTALTGVLERYASDRVRQYASLALAKTIANNDADPLWPRLESDLQRMFEVPAAGWLAKNLLVTRKARTAGSAAAFEYIWGRLDNAPKLQESLELATIAIRMLLDRNQALDAAMLASSLDREVAEMMLDLRARVEFLRLAAEAWRRQARAFPEPSAQERANTYASAYAEATH
jgi:hypothetical protein